MLKECKSAAMSRLFVLEVGDLNLVLCCCVQESPTMIPH